MKNLNLLIKSLLLIFYVSAEKLVCYSKTKVESEEIYRYFHGKHSGFYIDVNPNYPIWDSSTVFLKSQGWHGLNLLTSNQQLIQFSNIRSDQLNILAQIATQNSSITGNSQSSKSIMSPMAQICKNFVPRKPQYLATPTKYLNSILMSNDWNNQKCKPKLILVREYEIGSAVDEKMIQSLNSYGYKKVSSFTDKISIFIDTKQMANFKKIEQSTTKILSKDPISFTEILINFAQKFGIFNQELKGNLIANQILVHFTKYNSNVDMAHLLQSTKINHPDADIKNILLMQFNPLINTLIIQASSFNITIQKFPQSQLYYHISYNTTIESQNKQIHVYIFNHEFVEIKESQIDVVTLLGNQDEQNQVEGDGIPTKGQKSQKQKKEQELLIEKARTESTIQSKRWGKAKESKKSAKQKNATLATMKIEPKIENLTPENILADEQIINRTILIVVLISSVMGSIILTAVITACIMKKKHKAHVRSRIKHNADLQIEQTTEPNIHPIERSVNHD